MFPAAEKLRAHDPRALAKAATAVENGDAAAAAFVRKYPGQGLIVGVTGPPGAGKSTLVDAMAERLRQQGRTVAILAIDPSSRATGGAILGDRIRMARHTGDSGIFIRSMATRGASGGLAAATAGMAKLFRSAGFDYIVIETMGVGQDEIAVASVADVTVLVLVPGMGDDVQAIKAGVMEIAHLFVVNKADHDGAEETERDIIASLSLASPSLASPSLAPGGRQPEVVRTVAVDGTGVDELLQALGRVGSARPVAREQFRIDHLGVAVRSIDAALGFYERLGLQVTSRETVAVERVHVAMLPIGETRLELLEAAGEESTIARFLEKRGEGLHHVALRVTNLEAAAERLRAGGARLLNEPRLGAGGHVYVFVHPADAGGVLWELIQA